MRVLIACETSGETRRHVVGDVRPYLRQPCWY